MQLNFPVIVKYVKFEFLGCIKMQNRESTGQTGGYAIPLLRKRNLPTLDARRFYGYTILR